MMTTVHESSQGTKRLARGDKPNYATTRNSRKSTLPPSNDTSSEKRTATQTAERSQKWDQSRDEAVQSRDESSNTLQLENYTPRQLEAYIKRLFVIGDKDKSGFLSKKEIGELLELSSFPFDLGKASDVMAQCDSNRDGKIALAEFRTLMMTTVHESSQSDASSSVNASHVLQTPSQLAITEEPRLLSSRAEKKWNQRPSPLPAKLEVVVPPVGVEAADESYRHVCL